MTTWWEEIFSAIALAGNSCSFKWSPQDHTRCTQPNVIVDRILSFLSLSSWRYFSLLFRPFVICLQGLPFNTLSNSPFWSWDSGLSGACWLKWPKSPRKITTCEWNIFSGGFGFQNFSEQRHWICNGWSKWPVFFGFMPKIKIDEIGAWESFLYFQSNKEKAKNSWVHFQ